MKNCLKLIHSRLKNSSNPWAVGGNLALILQGTPVSARNIEIYTTRIGIYDFPTHFKKNAVKGIQPVKTDKFEGFLGSFKILDTVVHVKGDVSLIYNSKKLFLPIDDICGQNAVVNIQGSDIPLIPLQWLYFMELAGNGDPKTLELIAEECEESSPVFDILELYGLYSELKENVQRDFG